VELGEAEPLGVLDHHQGGLRDVDAHLDHGGGHQDVEPAPVEGVHDLLLLGAFHPAVDQADAELREHVPLQVLGHPGGVLEIEGLRFRDEGVDDEDLVGLCDLLPDDLVDAGTLPLVEDLRPDGLLPRGHLVDDRDVQIPIDGHRERSGDGGRRHDQHVRVGALGAQGGALHDPEAMLLVDDREAELPELHPLLDEGMGADDDVDLPRLDLPGDLPLLRAAHPAHQQGRPQA